MEQEKILQLRNVSKFYYTNGQVSSGFTKVSLDLSMGEFVVIVGESGSGKSTLLNVISGLDSYQEGEMYIHGEETSHYGDLDFEEYRKKYIGNIFQNFNLINSYTVYQNVELMMLMNGHTSGEIKPKVMELLKQVGLEKYARQKVSKLSGGQKQRVAIARVLAKDTPIVVADEPTGNLDVESARSVFETLHEISKNKLVVIVTHNYEQVEQYATRRIRMHDGKIVEDEVITP
ncbi:MAG: ABC transporter ATP-binding protein, partial [Erysipelotrichaceae bacterium]|nr:ABC transporter ATP-binding protein [Erysipelotrichaceae bacterium]